jgi:hypothetical protein
MCLCIYLKNSGIVIASYVKNCICGVAAWQLKTTKYLKMVLKLRHGNITLKILITDYGPTLGIAEEKCRFLLVECVQYTVQGSRQHVVLIGIQPNVYNNYLIQTAAVIFTFFEVISFWNLSILES